MFLSDEVCFNFLGMLVDILRDSKSTFRDSFLLILIVYLSK